MWNIWKRGFRAQNMYVRTSGFLKILVFLEKNRVSVRGNTVGFNYTYTSIVRQHQIILMSVLDAQNIGGNTVTGQRRRKSIHTLHIHLRIDFLILRTDIVDVPIQKFVIDADRRAELFREALDLENRVTMLNDVDHSNLKAEFVVFKSALQ